MVKRELKSLRVSILAVLAALLCLAALVCDAQSIGVVGNVVVAAGILEGLAAATLAYLFIWLRLKFLAVVVLVGFAFIIAFELRVLF